MNYNKKTMPDITDTRLPLKTVLPILVWVVSMAGIYYKMDGELDKMKEKVAVLEEQNKQYNPQLLDFKITTIQSQLNDINGKTDKITRLLSR